MTALTAAANVVIVAGKGGVGKTTVTAVLARAAADAGQRVLVVELDGKPALAELLAGTSVDVRHISAAAALGEYLVEHGFRRIAKRLTASGVIDVVGAAAPGIDDLVVLGKIKQLERGGDYDAILVDGPAAGHAVTMLTSPAALLDTARGGPVHTQAAEVTAMLRDPARCRVVLVTVAEATPVNELIEASFAIEDRAGVQLAAVVVNAVDTGAALPDPDRVALAGAPAAVAAARQAAGFRRTRRAEQAVELARLAAAVPLPMVELPALQVAGLTPELVGRLAASLAAPVAEAG